MKLSNIILLLVCWLLIIMPTSFAKDSNNTLVDEAKKLKNIKDKVGRPLRFKNNKEVFGNNIELSFAIDWRSDFLIDVALKLSQEKKEYILGYKELKEGSEENNDGYQTIGHSTKLQLNNIINKKRKVNFALIYVKNNYDLSTRKDKYFILRMENIFEQNNKLKITTDCALSSDDAQYNFQKLKLNWERKDQLSAVDRIIYNVQAGLASSETPSEYQFKTGGYNDIKLRGQDNEKGGKIYLANSVQYRRKLVGKRKLGVVAVKNILGTAFIDLGQLATRDSFFHQGLEVDFGVGAKINLGLGAINTEIAMDDFSSNPVLHIEFDEDF